MSTLTLEPLPMSQTKDDLLKYLNMPPETYAMMAKEADEVYRRLTSERSHLKSNSINKHPPYDYSDIVEKSKDEAMRQIARGGDEHTSYYWSLATETDDCPNWIARWFLYHKFRYRDGRNRNPAKSHGGKHKHSSHSSKNSHHRHSGDTGESGRHSESYYATTPSSSTYGHYSQINGYSTAVSSTSPVAYPNYNTGYDTGQLSYGSVSQSHPSAGNNGNDEQGSATYYDPVRDI